jgi:hypothetical protein
MDEDRLESDRRSSAQPRTPRFAPSAVRIARLWSVSETLSCVAGYSSFPILIYFFAKIRKSEEYLPSLCQDLTKYDVF